MENAVESANRSSRAKSEEKNGEATTGAPNPCKQQMPMELAQFTGYLSKPSCMFLVRLRARVLHSFAAIVLRKSIQQFGEKGGYPVTQKYRPTSSMQTPYER